MLRQIVEDEMVSGAIDDASEESPWLRDSWEALKWLLARRPEIGHGLGLGEHIRTHKQDGYLSLNIPTITVLYEYDDDTVTIRAVRLTDVEEC